MLIIEDHSSEKQRMDALTIENDRLTALYEQQLIKTVQLQAKMRKLEHDRDRYARYIRDRHDLWEYAVTVAGRNINANIALGKEVQALKEALDKANALIRKLEQRRKRHEQSGTAKAGKGGSQAQEGGGSDRQEV